MGFFSPLKPIPQDKQPISQGKQLWLNFDQNFRFKSSGTTLLETIVSYQKLLPSLPHENPFSSVCRNFNNSLSLYLSLNSELYVAWKIKRIQQSKNEITGQESLLSYFLWPKIKNKQAVRHIFLSPPISILVLHD